MILDKILKAVCPLTKRELDILYLREHQDLYSVAKSYGVTPRRIKEIEELATRKLLKAYVDKKLKGKNAKD